MLERNLFFLTLLVLLWAWQVLLVSAFVFGHFPPSSGLVSQVLPEWRYLLKPEWKPLIYHLVLMFTVACAGILWWVNRRQINSKDLLKGRQAYLALEAAVTFLWTSAAFKMIIYADRAVLAHDAFLVLFAAACVCKVFYRHWQEWAHRLHWPRIREWWVPAGLLVLLFIPDIEGVTARMFIGEQFHHNDSFIMGPGWAYLSGQRLDVDVISQYGIGFVAVISRLAEFFGGFSYEHVVRVMVVGTMAYYLAWYFLIRRWLGSIVLAAAVMLLAVKWQMFQGGAYPFVFTYGSMTPVRFIYDVVYFWCLWMHMTTTNKNWLWAAGGACGFGIYYLTTEGVYGTASFIAYVVLLLALPFWRKHFHMRLRDGFLILFPFAAAIALLSLTIGHPIATPQFWGNIGEFVNYFLSGFGLEPMYKSLLERHYLESLMGFVIPAAYLLTLLVFLSRLAVNVSENTEWLVVALCFYGLGTYHYYVARSASTAYYTVALPFVCILGLWIKIGIDHLKETWRMPARSIILGLAAWALATTHLFLAYPNMINLSSHPLTDAKVAMPLPNGKPYFNHLFRDFEPELKLPVNSLGGTEEELLAEGDFADDAALVRYYRKNSRFTRDAALIASLTARSEEVPLISSFEVEMLMQADRKPFFYYFPLLISRPMTMRCFSACSIYTTDQLVKTLNKFEEVKPAYVFMERIYMVNEVPQAYLFRFPSLVPLVNYVRNHYTLVAQGEYLVALKRMQ